MNSKLFPVIGVAFAVLLFLIAAARFPGGYHWDRDYVSTLLRARPDHPLPAGTRMPAIGAVLCFSVSLGFVFFRLSTIAPTRGHRKVIQIAGIASMIYASFTATPMHDLMVTLSLVAFAIAAVAIMHWLYLCREYSLLLFGGLSFVSLGVSAVLYYGGWFGEFLVVTQKASFVLCAAWLLWVHAAKVRSVRQAPKPVGDNPRLTADR